MDKTLVLAAADIYNASVHPYILFVLSKTQNYMLLS